MIKLTEGLYELQKVEDDKAGIYIENERVDVLNLIGNKYIVVNVEKWVSLNGDALYRIDLEPAW